jgi:hypothetical protein
LQTVTQDEISLKEVVRRLVAAKWLVISMVVSYAVLVLIICAAWREEAPQ